MSFYITSFGSKRGLLNHVSARAAMAFGAYNRYRSIEFGKVSRIVFVCKGNICRSAYADAFGRQLGMVCDSAGIAAPDGDPANERVIAFAGNRNVHLNSHLTRRLDQQQYGANDLLVGMEPQHLEAMNKAANGAQVTLLGLWHKPFRPYLHDPYSAPLPYLATCIDYIEESVREIIKRVPQTGV